MRKPYPMSGLLTLGLIAFLSSVDALARALPEFTGLVEQYRPRAAALDVD